jgi:glycosyltransferase involved in cell wall biosynthesis
VTSDRRVSLVVPLQDEELTVRELLASVAKQTRPPDEIVLVDAGSRDRTVERALGAGLSRHLRIVRTSRIFPGAARNEGVAAAQFEWIAFTDGGIALHPEWLQELLARATCEVDVVFGGVDPVCDTYFRECAAVAYVPPRDEHGVRGPFVASSLMRRSIFSSAGGFPNYRAAEDLIFVERARAAGARFAYAPSAVVWWQLAGTLNATFSRFAVYSYHNLVAGWGRHWHLGVARLYVLLALAISGLALSGTGLPAWPLVPLFFITRAAKAARLKRGSFGFSTTHPGRIFGAAGLLVVIDAATAIGWLRWLREALRR